MATSVPPIMVLSRSWLPAGEEDAFDLVEHVQPLPVLAVGPALRWGATSPRSRPDCGTAPRSGGRCRSPGGGGDDGDPAAPAPPQSVAKRRRMATSPIFSSAPPTGMMNPEPSSTRFLRWQLGVAENKLAGGVMPFAWTYCCLTRTSPSPPTALPHVPPAPRHHVLDSAIRHRAPPGPRPPRRPAPLPRQPQHAGEVAGERRQHPLQRLPGTRAAPGASRRTPPGAPRPAPPLGRRSSNTGDTRRRRSSPSPAPAAARRRGTAPAPRPPARHPRPPPRETR